jgi:carbon monoxide dehydrogenase subunit G
VPGEIVKHRLIGAAFGVFLPITASSQDSWVNDKSVQQELAAGQVAVRIAFDGDESHVRVDAAVKINAGADAVWRVLTDCDHAATFIPGVKRCRRVQTAPDNSWELIEQESKYSWLMPTVTTVVRADYKRPQRIDFKRVSGDLKDETGAWVLDVVQPAGTHGDTTIVEYELHVDPGFWIPKVLVRHSLRTELPAALTAIRERVEAKD